MTNKTNKPFKIELPDNKDNKELLNYLINNKSINLNLIDKINNFYIILSSGNLKIELPFNYIIIGTNKKLNGIPYINLETICSSYKLGLCNIETGLCYSTRDQKRFKHNDYKIKLNVLFFKEVQKNKELFKTVIKYLNQFKLIRFNNNNDIPDKTSILFLKELALNLNNNVILSGYTNRYDLLPDQKTLNKYKLPDNLIFNGSGYMLHNNYKTTTNLKLYIDNIKYSCLGSCLNCLKCYNKNNKVIYCLLHGSINTIDKYFNYHDNRQYLINIFNKQFNLSLNHNDLKINKGLLLSLNKQLELNNVDLKFKNYPELITYIGSVIND